VTALLPIEDPAAFAATRLSWHTVAEHVLAKARWLATGRIGLRAAPGGFGTPHFGDDRRALVALDTIVREEYGDAAATPISTVRAAGEWIGVEPGATAAMGPTTTTLDLDATLEVDPAAARVLAAWYAFADAALQALRTAHLERDDATQMPSLVQIWPEHFDMAVEVGDAARTHRAGYGASPGDAAIPDPYVYVSPWDKARVDPADGFWNQSWGAALGYQQLLAAPDPLEAARAFFAHAELRIEEPRG
jgi:hypothetical protein